MIIIGSPNVTNYEYSATIFLTGLPSTQGSPAIAAGVPYLQYIDTSTYISTSGVKIAPSITDPSMNVIYQGDFVTNYIPANGILNIPLPTYGGIIGYGIYQINSQLQDSVPTIYTYTPTKTVQICKPNNIQEWNNAANTNNNNGGGMCIINNVQCQNGQLCIQDSTSYIYNGVAGTITNQPSVQVAFPQNPFGGSLTPNFVANFLPVCVPITLNGRYQILINNYVTYSYPLYVYVVIGYSYYNDNLLVQCNIDPCQIVCEYDNLIKAYQDSAANPDNGSAAAENLILASSLLIKLLSFQSCGIDLGCVLQEIQDLGINCDCLCQTTAITPSIIPSGGGGTWSINFVCGDITGTLNQVGNNVQINLQDKSYVVAIAQDGSQNLAVITPTLNGCTKTYTISLSALVGQIASIESALVSQGSAIGSLNSSLLILENEFSTFVSYPDLTWIALSFANSWSQVVAFETCKYSIDPVRKTVIIKGSIKNTATNVNLPMFAVNPSIAPNKYIRRSINIIDTTTGLDYPAIVIIDITGGVTPTFNGSLTGSDNIELDLFLEYQLID